MHVETAKLEEIETLIGKINGDDVQEKRGLWEKLKHTLKDVLQLHIDIADAMKEDAERWAEEERLQSPACRQEDGDHCQQHS